ncbi:MAG: SelB C-terminal domain-containing protein [Pseudonocardia sp.]
MLAGVGPVPAVLFVVAADEGWMPQSSEHLDALAALGARHGLLVVTRSDLMEPELALAEAQERLAASALGELPSVCVSAVTGEGLDALRTAVGELVATLPSPDPGADVRLWVDRAFTIRGAGTVVTGTLPAGTLSVDDELLLQPGGQRVTVRALQCLGESVQRISGVARVAVNLRGVALEAVGRGSVLVTPGRWLTTAVLDARLRPVSGTGPATDLPVQLRLHIGAASVTARPRPLGADTVRLTLDTTLPLRIGDRALLRDPGRHHIAAGLTVLDVAPPPLRRRGAAAARADVLHGMDGRPDAAGELVRRGLVRREELAAMGADPATAAGSALTAGGWLLHAGRADELVARLVAAVADHAVEDPLEPGLPAAAARRRLELPVAALVEALITTHPEAGLKLRDGRVQLVSNDPDALPTTLREPLEQLRRDLSHARFAAPEAARLAELGLGPKQLAALVRAGELDKLADGVFLLPGADIAALAELARLGEEFTLSAARQALGTSRRVALPLLERLARLGHTVRTDTGDHRLVT